jgi:hypothetical protein
VLSRHYRLSTGLLQQQFATLEEALHVLRRLRSWVVIDRPVRTDDANYDAALRMRLDTTMLPKPFQLSALTAASSRWNPAGGASSSGRRRRQRPGRSARSEGGGHPMRVLLLIGAALAGVLLFLLATASANKRLFFARHYSLLLGLNAALQRRASTRRLAARAAGAQISSVNSAPGCAAAAGDARSDGAAPGRSCISCRCSSLRARASIWFDVKVDAALEGAKFLGQSSIRPDAG